MRNLLAIFLIGSVVFFASCSANRTRSESLSFWLKQAYVIVDDSGQVHIPYMFFNCCIYNKGQDTIEWSYLDYNDWCYFKKGIRND